MGNPWNLPYSCIKFDTSTTKIGCIMWLENGGWYFQISRPKKLPTDSFLEDLSLRPLEVSHLMYWKVGEFLPGKLTCPLKINGWKMYFLLKQSLFRGHVSFQGCINFLWVTKSPNVSGTKKNALHKPYPYSLYRWGFLHFRYLKCLVIYESQQQGIVKYTCKIVNKVFEMSMA